MKKLLLILVMAIPLFAFSQTEKTESDTVKWAYPPNPVRTQRPYQQTPSVIPDYSSGDHLYMAGKKYLTAISMSVGGMAVFTIGAVTDMPELGIVGGLISLVGFGFSVAGHFELMEAGKAINREAVTISAASEGLGLAINF